LVAAIQSAFQRGQKNRPRGNHRAGPISFQRPVRGPPWSKFYHWIFGEQIPGLAM